MDFIQLVVLGLGLAAGGLSTTGILLARKDEYIWGVSVLFLVYLSTSTILNLLQVGSIIFMGVTLTLFLKAVILGALIAITYNRLK